MGTRTKEANFKITFFGPKETATTFSASGWVDRDPCMPTESGDYNLNGDWSYLRLI